MGQCLGKPARGATLSAKQNSSAVSSPIPTSGNPTPASANGAVADKDKDKTRVAVDGGFTFTKGASMALPEKEDKLAAAKDTTNGGNKDAQEIEEFLADATNFAEEEDSPVYARVDKAFKVGDPVVYAPEMKNSITFFLAPNDDPEHSPSGDESGVTAPTPVTFAYKSLRGNSEARNAPDKPNQDSVAVVRDKEDPAFAIFAVFDGHGPFGEHASHFCRMELLKLYTVAKKKHPDESPKQLIGRTLGYLDRKFGATDHKKVKVDPIVSGTTAIVVMLHGNEIIAANVGDSRAIIAAKDVNGKISVEQLSDDHKPERPDERERIERSNAILMSEHEVRGGRPSSPSTASASKSSSDLGASAGKTYICRHARGEIVYGVLFTRSLGDVDAHKNLGVISDPEFRETKIDVDNDNSQSQVIILASDGVWDVMGNKEAAERAFSSMNPVEACAEIVDVCAQRWKTSGEGRRDDITVCIVGLGSSFEQTTDPTGDTFGII